VRIEKAVGAVTSAIVTLMIVLAAFAMLPASDERAGTAGAATLTVSSSGGADYTSIQEAVDAAEPGDTVFVGAGWYEEYVMINKSIQLIGEDVLNTVLSPGWNNGLTLEVSADDVYISGFTFGGGHSSYIGIYIHDSNWTRVTGNVMANIVYGLWSVASYNVTIDRNLFTGDTLTYFWASRDITLAHNIMSDHSGVILDYSMRCTMYNNTLGTEGIRFETPDERYLDHDISQNNTVAGGPVHFLRDVKDHVVSDDVGQLIMAGCRNVTVRGLTPGGINGIHLIRSQGCLIEGNSANIRLDASFDNTIRNNTSPEWDDDLNSRTALTLYSSHGNVIQDNVWSGSDWTACSLDESDGNLLRGNYMTDNGKGISLFDSQNNTVEGNDIFSNEDIGIGVRYCNTTLIRDNSCSANRIGIELEYSSYSTIAGNVCDNNREDGIAARWSTGIDIRDNECRINRDSGIIASIYDSLISNNICESNHNSGIYLYGDRNSVEDNTCNSNYDDGLFISSNNNSITGNNCTSNRQHGLHLEGHDNIIEGNYLHLNTRYDMDVNDPDNVFIDNNFGTNESYRWNREHDDEDDWDDDFDEYTEGQVALFLVGCFSTTFVVIIFLIILAGRIERKREKEEGQEEPLSMKDMGRRKGPGKALDPKLYGK
jgi:parallel beta-helix repeat protein